MANNFFFTRLQYESGDWDTDQRMPSNVLNSLIEYTTIEVDTEIRIIPPLIELIVFRFALRKLSIDPAGPDDINLPNIDENSPGNPAINRRVCR